MAPPIQVKTSSKEDRFTLAIDAYKAGWFTGKRQAAKSYDIPESTLWARLKGRVSHDKFRSVNHKLTTTEDEALVQWILSMSE